MNKKFKEINQQLPDDEDDRNLGFKDIYKFDKPEPNDKEKLKGTIMIICLAAVILFLIVACFKFR